jgi:hypothetical protein
MNDTPTTGPGKAEEQPTDENAPVTVKADVSSSGASAGAGGDAPAAQSADAAAQENADGAAQDSADEAAPLSGAAASGQMGAIDSPGFRERGRMRRRIRFLRKARELAYRDLGGLVFDLHRFGRRNDQLVLAKLDTIGRIDGELRTLEAALAERQPVTVLREAGVAACPRCAAIHGSDDRFCPNCGLAMDLRAERPIAGAAASAPAAAPAAGPAPAPTPTPAQAAASAPTPSPAAAGTAASAPGPAAAPAPKTAPDPAERSPALETPEGSPGRDGPAEERPTEIIRPSAKSR